MHKINADASTHHIAGQRIGRPSSSHPSLCCELCGLTAC